MILEEIDKQKIALGEKALLEGNLDGIDEQIKNDKQLEEMKQQKEQNVETPDNSKEKSLSSAEAYFSSLIKNITSDKESEHTVLAVESLPELRAYFQDNEVLGSWIDDVGDEKIISLGANLLPKLHAHGEVSETIKQNGNMTREIHSFKKTPSKMRPDSMVMIFLWRMITMPLSITILWVVLMNFYVESVYRISNFP